jgi:hypothetical protein
MPAIRHNLGWRSQRLGRDLTAEQADRFPAYHDGADQAVLDRLQGQQVGQASVCGSRGRVNEDRHRLVCRATRVV